MNKLSFVILASILACAQLAFAQGKPVATDDTKLVQNLNAPPPAVTDIRPSESNAAATMPQVESKVLVPDGLASAAFPDTLKGRWYSPNGQYSQVVALKKVSGTWRLTWYKLHPAGCTLEDAPVLVKPAKDSSGGVEVSINNYDCMKTLSMTLTKNGNEFTGQGNAETALGGGRFTIRLQ